MHMPQHTCEHQSTVCSSWYFHSTVVVLGMYASSSGLATGTFIHQAILPALVPNIQCVIILLCVQERVFQCRA